MALKDKLEMPMKKVKKDMPMDEFDPEVEAELEPEMDDEEDFDMEEDMGMEEEGMSEGPVMEIIDMLQDLSPEELSEVSDEIDSLMSGGEEAEDMGEGEDYEMDDEEEL